MSTPGMSTPGMSTSGMSTSGMSIPGMSIPGMSIPGMSTTRMSIHRWWRPATVAVLVLAVMLAAACSGPRSGASANNGVAGCAAVLPLARTIVHDEGTLTYIRRISRNDADALSRRLGVTPPPASPQSHPLPRHPARTGWPKTCLVVYHGDYPAGTIIEASPPAVGGHYALLLLRVRHPTIDRVLVTDQLPPGLRS